MPIEVEIKDFGFPNDPDIWSTAMSVLIAGGGGTLYLEPTREYTFGSTPLILDMSEKIGRFDKLINIKGSGSGTCAINCAGGGIKYQGKLGHPEALFQLEGVSILGNGTSSIAYGNTGLDVRVAAWMGIKDVVVEGFYQNTLFQDVEQSQMQDMLARNGVRGMDFYPSGGSTDPNSILLTNVCVSNNLKTGISGSHLNAFTMIGGSIQYNGRVQDDYTSYGFRSIDAGSGYGTHNFIGVAFEGNGGFGDIVGIQNNYPTTYDIRGCGFTRTVGFGPTVGYGTHSIYMEGPQQINIVTAANYFMHGYGYVPSAARPRWNINAAGNCVPFTDGSDIYMSPVEAPSWNGVAVMPRGLAVGRRSPIGVFTARPGPDANFYVGTGWLPGLGVAIGAVNDANGQLKPLELRTSRLSVSYMPPSPDGLYSGCLWCGADGIVRRVP